MRIPKLIADRIIRDSDGYKLTFAKPVNPEPPRQTLAEAAEEEYAAQSRVRGLIDDAMSKL